MDDSGFFSVQVISRALGVWGLDLVQLNSSDPAAVRARASPVAAAAYVCNYREHCESSTRRNSLSSELDRYSQPSACLLS